MAKRFRVIKPEIRVLGVDDGVFAPRTKGKADVVGVVYRGGYCLDGVMRTEVEIDGLDATEKLVSMVKESSHYRQLRVIMLNGLTLGGFNTINAKDLHEKTGLPVIVVTREKPDMAAIKEALKNLYESSRRWRMLQSGGEVFEVSTRKPDEPVYMQAIGVDQADAEKIVRQTATHSNIPEALRVAHIIASGLSNLQKNRCEPI